MSKREDANNTFRPSDSPLTEHEKEQIALRKNMARLRELRLPDEALRIDVRGLAPRRSLSNARCPMI
jgi:hypothetical protein